MTRKYTVSRFREQQMKTMSKNKQRERDKRQKIRGLKDVANKEFHRSSTIRKKWLICALHCGEALLEIKRLLGHGQWIPWLEKNFDGSVRTAEVYMGIAKHWGDSRVSEMKKKNIEINTIKDFYDAILGKEETIPINKQDKEHIIYERYRKLLIKEFTNEVNRLGRWKPWYKRYELFTLGDNFWYFWGGLQIELKKAAKEEENKGTYKHLRKLAKKRQREKNSKYSQ